MSPNGTMTNRPMAMRNVIRLAAGLRKDLKDAMDEGEGVKRGMAVVVPRVAVVGIASHPRSTMNRATVMYAERRSRLRLHPRFRPARIRRILKF